MCINNYTPDNYYSLLVAIVDIKWIGLAMSDKDWTVFAAFFKLLLGELLAYIH